MIRKIDQTVWREVQWQATHPARSITPRALQLHSSPEYQSRINTSSSSHPHITHQINAGGVSRLWLGTRACSPYPLLPRSCCNPLLVSWPLQPDTQQKQDTDGWSQGTEMEEDEQDPDSWDSGAPDRMYSRSLELHQARQLAQGAWPGPPSPFLFLMWFGFIWIDLVLLLEASPLLSG